MALVPLSKKSQLKEVVLKTDERSRILASKETLIPYDFFARALWDKNQVLLDVSAQFLDRFLLGMTDPEEKLYLKEVQFFKDPDNYVPCTIEVRVQDKVFHSSPRTLMKSNYIRAKLEYEAKQSLVLVLREDPKGFEHFLSRMRDPEYQIPEEYRILDQVYQLSEPLIQKKQWNPGPVRDSGFLGNSNSSGTDQLAEYTCHNPQVTWSYGTYKRFIDFKQGTSRIKAVPDSKPYVLKFEVPQDTHKIHRKHCLVASMSKGQGIEGLKRLRACFVHGGQEISVLFDLKNHGWSILATMATFFPLDMERYQRYLARGMLFVPLYAFADLNGQFSAYGFFTGTMVLTAEFEKGTKLTEPFLCSETYNYNEEEHHRRYALTGGVQDLLVSLPYCKPVLSDGKARSLHLAGGHEIIHALIVCPGCTSDPFGSIKIKARYSDRILYESDPVSREIPFVGNNRELIHEDRWEVESAHIEPFTWEHVNKNPDSLGYMHGLRRGIVQLTMCLYHPLMLSPSGHLTLPESDLILEPLEDSVLGRVYVVLYSRSIQRIGQTCLPLNPCPFQEQ